MLSKAIIFGTVVRPVQVAAFVCSFFVALAPLQTCRAAERFNPEAKRLLLQAAKEGQTMGSRGAALKHIDQALALEPHRAEIWAEKAIILDGLEEDAEALPCIEMALKISPKVTTYWTEKAHVLNSLKRHQEALAAVDTAVKLDATYYARLQRTEILMAMSRFAEAESELNALVAKQPSNLVIRARHSDAARRMGHWDAVIEDSTFLLTTVKPESYSYYSLLEDRARAYIEKKQYDKAIADYKLGLKHSPDDRKLHAALLKVYKLKGDAQGVRTETQALKEFDDDFKPL
ncbi:MAG: hypothetical protein JST01_12050 [Cyanobacteria bacterium SZAS TMP-1]|nr:hypothetical protein [Cyanobacteria bacterium SZAS TMP-1]